LTGTHIGSWVGCPRDQVEIRERIASNATAMCLLAAKRLETTKWFGILEDLDRSMELLKHTFQLETLPKMPHIRQKSRSDASIKISAIEVLGLASLMPQDLWLYEYGKRLFEARWEKYKTGIYTPPELPPLPKTFSCISTRFTLNCTSGPLSSYYASN